MSDAEEDLPKDWDVEPGAATESVRRDLAPYRNPHGSPLAKRDHLGRKQPHRLSLADFIVAIPGMAGRTRRVPAAAILELTETEETATALLRCPCGAQPIATPEAVKCSGCERYYVVLGDSVLVIYGAMASLVVRGAD